jgi:hypothetical protein
VKESSNKRNRLRKVKAPSVRYHLALEKLRQLKPDNCEFFTFGEIELNEAESIVLSLGLKFQPHLSNENEAIHASITNSLNTFNRKLKLRLYFASNNKNESDIPLILNNKFIPDAENEDWFKLIDSYSENAMYLLRKSKPFSSTIPSEHKLIQQTLAGLKQRTDIIIKPADKNLGLAVFSKSFYVAMCNEHLSDRSTYQIITKDDPRFTGFNDFGFQQLKDILLKHKVLYSSNDSERFSKLARSLLQLSIICPNELRTSKFYGLPKVHKSPLAARPIVDNVNSLTYFTSKYLHSKLWRIATKINTICKSSKEVIQELNNNNMSFTAGSVIMCADIRQLYPSIPLDFGLKAVHYVIHCFPGVYAHEETTLLMDLLQWVLTHNYFTFQDNLYLQIKGTAMGTPVAVAYANIVIFYIESHCLQATSPQYYKRFVDDVVSVISLHEGKIFINSFNNVCSSIQFDDSSVTLEDQGVFLDIHLSLVHQEGSKQLAIKTNIFQKQMNKYLYIPPSSAHPTQLLRNIIRQEIIRYKLFCSEESDFLQVKNAFFRRLQKRGYTDQFLDTIFNSDIPSRSMLLEKLDLKKSNEHKPSKPIITLQLPNIIDGPNLKSILKLPTELTEHPKFAQIYTNKLTLGYRYNGSIKDILVHS